MVMISHDKAFIFLKTRKTAGTSIEMILEPWCRPPGATVTEKTPTLRSAQGIVGRRLTPRPRWHRILMVTDWYNHMPAAEVRRKLGADRFDRYRKITAIRNPFDLAVSRFHWELARRGLPEAEDFAITRARFSDMVRSGQFDGDHDIVHVDGRYAIDDTIRFESMTADLQALVQSIAPGHPPITIPHTKKTSNRRSHSVADYFDHDSIAALRRSAAWVFDRFGYPETPGT